MPLISLSHSEHDRLIRLEQENCGLRAIIKAQAEDLESVREEALRLALELREAVDRAKALEARQ